MSNYHGMLMNTFQCEHTQHVKKLCLKLPESPKYRFLNVCTGRFINSFHSSDHNTYKVLGKGALRLAYCSGVIGKRNNFASKLILEQYEKWMSFYLECEDEEGLSEMIERDLKEAEDFNKGYKSAHNVYSEGESEDEEEDEYSMSEEDNDEEVLDVSAEESEEEFEFKNKKKEKVCGKKLRKFNFRELDLNEKESIEEISDETTKDEKYFEIPVLDYQKSEVEKKQGKRSLRIDDTEDDLHEFDVKNVQKNASSKKINKKKPKNQNRKAKFAFLKSTTLTS